MLKVNQLCKSFEIHHLNKQIEGIQDISFNVEKGQFLGIIGKSGSGKSTILKCIYRTYTPTSGRILFESAQLGTVDLATCDERTMMHIRKHDIGYVSQFLQVMPRTSVLDIVINAQLEMNVPYDVAKDKAIRTLKHFGIDETLFDNYPNTMSGGEKLRLNIARAVVKEPVLLLLDEPTASLDNASKLKVREAIERLKANKTTLIGIFHDLEFMEGLCDDVFDMQAVVKGDTHD
ncbi:phosphonate C-P lyase system protein PhnL [Macrococcoides caseolyticum]|uniref:phosphonate C-P lyase system protein PhnL n=1 Tax=Macrococcoides caseolyticum TaxID=69966 RepID=UPI001F319CA6|nr:ATP-binding cassette domain-containing protein [Macrococcus caseolyticus]MCE4956011.1 ATP-binding cassette domain-containing protein [Macrococcus caseolyticus]